MHINQVAVRVETLIDLNNKLHLDLNNWFVTSEDYALIFSYIGEFEMNFWLIKDNRTLSRMTHPDRNIDGMFTDPSDPFAEPTFLVEDDIQFIEDTLEVIW